MHSRGRKQVSTGAAAAVSFISLLIVTGTLLPVIARASVMSVILASIKGNVANAEVVSGQGSIQTMGALKPAMNIDPSPATGGGDVTIVDDSALVPEEGPAGTIADIEKPKVATVSVYIVQDGDTISSIAQLFDVPQSTIRWANDIPAGGSLSVGQKLIILPVPGIIYTVKKGDTLETIAKKTGSDAAGIGSYNGIDDSTLAVGAQIIIPDGEVPATAETKLASKPSTKVLVGKTASGKVIPFANNPAEPAHNVGPVGTMAEISYYISPLSHYIQTQGIHGYNAVDLAAPSGTPIMAAATGEVIVARAGGYNGGYGSYVVIQHQNGSQTLYGHMSKVAVYDGEHVVQGQVIGYVGTTGSSTGPHVHFEIRNGIRNPF